MIKTMLDISDMCHKCPWFEADIEENRVYAGDMYADTDIHIFCKNKNLCNHIKSFVADEAQDKLSKKPYCRDCRYYDTSDERCERCIFYRDSKSDSCSYYESKEDE